MDSFEINKILMATILALLLWITSEKLGDILVNPQKLTKHVYAIEGAVPEEKTSPLKTSRIPTDSDEEIEPLIASANIQKGRELAGKCIPCHTLEKKGKNKIGPNLWNIVDSPIGYSDVYIYSASLREKKGNWNYQNLNLFLKSPRSFIQGTKMIFAGIRKARDRADLIAYLGTLSERPDSIEENQGNKNRDGQKPTIHQQN